MEGIPIGKSQKSATVLEEEIKGATKELHIVESLKHALMAYIAIDDYAIADDNTDWHFLTLGRLEMSLIQRRQMIDDNRKRLADLRENRNE